MKINVKEDSYCCPYLKARSNYYLVISVPLTSILCTLCHSVTTSFPSLSLMEMTLGGGVSPDLDPRDRDLWSSTMLPILFIERPEAELFLEPRELPPTCRD